MIDKTVARILAVQVVYSLCWDAASAKDFSTLDLDRHISEMIDLGKTDEDMSWDVEANPRFVFRLAKCCIENFNEIDGIIRSLLDATWKLERITSVSTAVLRVGISELISCPNNPVKVVISEYIAISDMFLNNEDAKFVHAILDKAVAICQKRGGGDSELHN